MSTTTIRLSDELKARIAAAAERTGKSTHSLILEAISEKADLEERRLEISDQAEARMEKIVATGKTVAWSDMRRYLEARAAGKPSARPKATKMRG